MPSITCDTCSRSFNSKIDFYKHLTSSPLGCKALETVVATEQSVTYPLFIGKRQINNKLEWDKYKIDETITNQKNVSTIRLGTRRPISTSSDVDVREKGIGNYGTSGSKMEYMHKIEYIRPDIRSLRTSGSHLSKDTIDDYIKKNTQKIITTRKNLDMVDDERPRIRSSADSGVTYQIGRTKYDTKIAYYNALTSMGKTEATVVNMNDITKLAQMHGKLRHELTSVRQFSEIVLLNQSSIIGDDYYVLDGITRHCSSTKKMIFKLTENIEGSILVIDATQVIIDLNGYEIRQSDSGAITDRFNTVVKLIGCSHCYVTGGIIGSSSKNSLEISNSSYILVSDVRLQGYEYAAIHITGSNSYNISLSNLKLLGNKTTVPVNGWYDVMSALIQELDDGLVNIFDKMTMNLIQKKVDGQFTRMNLSLFDNKTGAVYTNTYGILIDIDDINDVDRNSNIYLSNIHINAQINSIDEVVTAYKDINGNAFPLFETMREDMTYEENMISKGQLLTNNGDVMVDPDYINNNAVYQFTKRLLFGIDHQMRSCIGNIGIMVKKGSNIGIEKCNCSNIINKSPMGKIPGNYDATNRNYLLQLQKEYKGANAYGIMIDGCSTVLLRDITISNIISASGASYGISVINNSKDIRISRLNVDKLRADNKTKLVLYHNNPTSMPAEIPRHVEGGSIVSSIV